MNPERILGWLFVILVVCVVVWFLNALLVKA